MGQTSSRALKRPLPKNIRTAACIRPAPSRSCPSHPSAAGSSRQTPTSRQKGAQPVEVAAGGGPSCLRHRWRGVGCCQGRRRRRHQDQSCVGSFSRQFSIHEPRPRPSGTDRLVRIAVRAGWDTTRRAVRGAARPDGVGQGQGLARGPSASRGSLSPPPPSLTPHP